MKTNTMYRLLLILLLLCLAVSTAAAQKSPANRQAPASAKPTLSAEVEAFHSGALQKTTPTVRRWIAEQARLEAQKAAGAASAEASLRQAVVTRFTGQTAGQAEIDMVTLVTYVEMVKSIALEIESGRRQVAQINTAMAALRGLLKELEHDVARTTDKSDADRCMAPLCGGNWVKTSASVADAQRQAGDDVPVVPAEIKTIGDLRTKTADVKAKLGALEAKGVALTESMQAQLAQMEALQVAIEELMKTVDTSEDYVFKTLK